MSRTSLRSNADLPRPSARGVSRPSRGDGWNTLGGIEVFLLRDGMTGADPSQRGIGEAARPGHPMFADTSATIPVRVADACILGRQPTAVQVC
jgi:hypothetical protein